MQPRSVVIDDDLLLVIYEWWSEETYCAGFMNPSNGMVQEFYNWINSDGPNPEHRDYETEMIDKFRAIEAAVQKEREDNYMARSSVFMGEPK
jgi:heme-degrading monooxygenase HmoA